MQQLDRLEKLAVLLETLDGNIYGRKKFHKLIYLLQQKEIDFGQDFIFHYYGVYSPTLSMDINKGIEWGVINEELEGQTYKVELKEKNETQPTFKEKELSLIKTISKESPVVLEVLSTIVYLHNNNYSGLRLRGKMKELKGHLSNYFEKAEELGIELFDITI